MADERWARVKEVFEAAAQLPADARDTWLDHACADEADVRDEVRELLRAHDEAPDFLDRPATAGDAAAVLVEHVRRAAAGRRLGAYRLVREIGRGGMGVVYEGARDEGDFSRRVAIKLLPAGWSASTLAERFRFERRVLAGLDHPGIARLYDAGTTEDGVPYFVMEYVEGQPIDAWCLGGTWSVRARVGTLLKVCEAVTHAHQNLVVHRDLKPANILVTADGQPKLLDFGIAALLSDEVAERSELTRAGHYAFTPEYASPEQVRGETVTTASDVYSLGLLLYLLVTGHPAVSVSGLGPVETMRAICEVDPAPPSAVVSPADRAQVRGDLDRIVMKALRKEPQERYRSVLAFADDLRAWLDGRAVAATPATLAYRGRKFVARHTLASAVAVGVAVTLVAGGAATAWQARVAQRERDKAERRFAQVRQFSESLIYDVHESLRLLPGATEPRRRLLERGVAFLDGLAQDAGNDLPFILGLAEGYRRLGHVQGSARSANVGDVAAARASFEKAARLCEQAMALEPASRPAALASTGAYDDLASARLEAGDAPGADQAQRRHREIVERIERSFSSDPDVRESLAGSYFGLGYFRGMRGDHAGAVPDYQRSVDLYRSLPPDRLDRDRATIGLSFSLKRLGAVWLLQQRFDDAERVYREAIALDRKVIARNPGRIGHEFDMTFAMSDLALIARRKGQPAEAFDIYSQVLAIRQRHVTADPKNVRAVRGLAATLGYLSATCADLKQADRQLAYRREQVRINRQLVAEGHLNTMPPLVLAYLVETLLAAADAGLPPGAAAHLAEARSVATEVEPAARKAAAAGSTDATTALEVLRGLRPRLAR